MKMDDPSVKKHIFIRIPKSGCVAVQHIGELAGRLITGATPANLVPGYSTDVTSYMAERGYNQPGLGHARWRDIKLEIRSAHQSVAVVRNPWSRVVSRYMFAVKAAQAYKYTVPSRPFTFEVFLEQRYKWKDVPFFWHRVIDGWYPSYDHVADDNGTIQCDILRFEHFSQDLTKYFGLTEPIAPRNVSNGKKSEDGLSIVERQDYRDFYTDVTAEIIANWYKVDIDQFGFTFDGTATKNIWKGLCDPT